MTPRPFDRLSPAASPQNYERFFVPAIGRPVAEDLIQAAALQTGERVLDVGCGTGVVTRLAAAKVGPGGTVAGLDVNPGMLAVARSVTPSDMAIEWHEADARAIPLPDESFDVVLCQMSLQFIPDRVQGLREMRRVLAPGGRLVLNVPGPAAPVFETLARAMGEHVAPQAEGFVRAVFALDDDGELESLLTEAGFRDVHVRAESRALSLPAPEEFLRQYVSSTPLAAIVAEADDRAQAALAADVIAQWNAFGGSDGMDFPQPMLTATAQR